jgi:hypothetical protein
MDFSKLSTGDKLVAGGALAFLVAMFLPWFTFSIGPADYSRNGWHFFLTGTIAMLLIIAAAALVVMPAAGKPMNAPAITIFGLTAIATVLVLLRVIIGDDNPLNRGFGLFVALIAAAAATYGGFTKFKAGGGSIQDLKDPNKLKNQMQSGFQTLAKDLKENARELKDDAKDLTNEVKDKLDGDSKQ